MKTVNENVFEVDYMSGKKVWNDWTRLWNGEFGLASQLVGPRFDLYLTAAVKGDPSGITDEKQVAAWIGRVRDSFGSVHYNTVAGPFVDTAAQAVSCYWEAKGIFAGKTDSPEDKPGKPFHVVGMDILKLKDGKICECRTMANPARPE